MLFGICRICFDFNLVALIVSTEPNNLMLTLNTLTVEIAEEIQSLVEEMNPCSSDASLFADLINHSLAVVDWEEIAESYLESKPRDLGQVLKLSCTHTYNQLNIMDDDTLRLLTMAVNKVCIELIEKGRPQDESDYDFLVQYLRKARFKNKEIAKLLTTELDSLTNIHDNVMTNGHYVPPEDEDDEEDKLLNEIFGND